MVYSTPPRNRAARPRAQRGAAPKRQPYDMEADAAPRRYKRGSTKRKNFFLRRLLLFVALLALGLGIGKTVLSMTQSVVGGGGAKLPTDITGGKEFQDDVKNILICGIDYEQGRAYGKAGEGMTDVILYLSVDLKNNKINVLQIPRDTFVGAQIATGGTYKVNAIAYKGSEKPPVVNLARYLKTNLGLPVDHYVTIDMDAFKEVVNMLGGIEVYVPERIQQDRNVLEKGYHKMDGATAEFFVRFRQYAQADIKRLDMQRYFYLGLYKKMTKEFPVGDILKILPSYFKYTQTDMDMAEMGMLAKAVRKVDAADITIYKVPGESANYNGNSVYSIHKEPLLKQLNQGFRSYLQPLSANEVKVPQLAHTNDHIPWEGTSLGSIKEQ